MIIELSQSLSWR